MAKGKRILTLAYDIPNNDKNITQYWDYLNERMSLSDYDIVVIKPLVYKVENLIEQVQYWHKEFTEFVKNGGVLFVELYKYEKIQTSDFLRSYDVSNYDVIPSDYKYLNTKGRVLVPKSPLVAKLYSTFKEVLKYNVQINGAADPTFVTRDGNKVLGAIQSLGKGYIVYLPDINLLECYGEDFEPDDDEYSEIEIKTGYKLLTCLNDIYNSLMSFESSAPEWLKGEHFTQKYTDIQSEIASVQKQIEELKEQKHNLQISLAQEQELSALLYETGKLLENAVSKALKILGYLQAENYNDGKLELDQVIVSPEGDRFIGECEGKDSTAINVDKFRQLNDSLYEDFQREEVLEKANGIIFGNPQRLSEPNKRTLTFTEKCINNARREKVGLVLTMDLFKAAKRVADTGDEEYARKCRQAIKEQLGEVVVFPEE